MATTHDLIVEAAAITEAWAELTDDDLDLALASYTDATDDKLRALRAVAMTAASKADLWRSEAEPLIHAAKMHDRTAERVSERATALLHARRELGLPTTVEGCARLQKAGGAASVVVSVPTEDLPFEYQRVRLEPKRTELAEALTRGETIPGVRLAERSESIRWAK